MYEWIEEEIGLQGLTHPLSTIKNTKLISFEVRPRFLKKNHQQHRLHRSKLNLVVTFRQRYKQTGDIIRYIDHRHAYAFRRFE